MRWAVGAPRAPIVEMLRTLERGEEPRDARTVKRSPVRHVLRAPLGPHDAVFWKRYRARSAREQLRFAGTRSRARQEFENLLRLRALGVAAVEALVCAERWEGPWLREAVLATRELAGAERLDHVLAALAPEARAPLLDALARLVRRLHEAGLWHRDLHCGNVLVAPNSGGPGPVLVDVQKMRRTLAPLPGALRTRDLGTLHHDLALRVGDAERERVLAVYASAGPRALPLAPFRKQVERAANRRARRRLRSRGRRCVTNSTGFRVERVGSYRIYRRADVPRESVLEVVEAHRRSGGQATRVENVVGGPPPGPAPRGFDRAQGLPEPGAPSRAAVYVQELCARAPLPWPARHSGMRAWREAHARLLSGEDVPAPLALAEERVRGCVRRAWLLTRA